METAAKLRQSPHQYVDRSTGEARDEELVADRLVNAIYSTAREKVRPVYRFAVGRLASKLLAYLAYENSLKFRLTDPEAYFRRLGIDPSECVEELSHFKTPREIFERQIRFWEMRPMNQDPDEVVCPADSRVLVGSLEKLSRLPVKETFFVLEELLGPERSELHRRFAGGDFAIFRLTPDKYHYSHFPVTGRVVDFYEIDGLYHSCNPGAVAAEGAPYSKNKRVVTLIDTDVRKGTGVGLVAFVEVVAMMIGKVVQRYSTLRYEAPVGLHKGMTVRKGAPKSLYRPGSSTDVVLFERGRVRFARDLLWNQSRTDVHSRFNPAFGGRLVETDVAVRQPLARRRHLYHAEVERC